MFGEIIWTKNSEAYYVKRIIPENRLKNPNMDILKKWFNCDTVLRNGDRLFFCNHIKCVDYEEL